jgi:predicted O-linked N-acetylglucosamine transferase (SPINDLY family)
MSKPNALSPRAKQELLRIVDLFKYGQPQNAHAAGLKFLSKHGHNFDVLHLMGTIELDNGRLQEAWIHWNKALELIPTHLILLNKLGGLARKLEKNSEAQDYFQKAISTDHRKPEAHFNLGNCLAAQSHWLLAIQSYTNAIGCSPQFVQAYNNLALALHNFGRPDEAVKVLDTAISLQPQEPFMHVNKAKALEAMSLRKAAIAYLRESLITVNEKFEILAVLADMEATENDYVNADLHFVQALNLNPNSDAVHNNYGNMLRSTGRLDEALNHYKKAVSINPLLYQAMQNLCNILNSRKNYAESLHFYEQVRKINPTSPYLPGMEMNSRMHTCTWDNWDMHVQEVKEGIHAEKKTANPFPLVAFNDDVSVQKQSACLWIKNECPSKNVLPAIDKKKRTNGQKIRVGYYSADLYTHATALLMTGVWESHDRERFEWVAFNFGPVKEDPLSLRVRKAFDQFVDVRGYGDRVVAQLSREMEIDIAIDLKGFTQEARTGIFAERAAPIQVNYLGFPGTMGANYIDYIIADKVIIPDELKKYYTESVVRLPYCYQTNDNQRPISDQVPTRQSQGLPENGRVLCSFNNNYKITPQVFDIWMRVLAQFPDCVLWLLQDNPKAAENLRLEANRRGIDSARLVFAPRMDNPDHLARHRLADLFIDTFPCNAHTTASDALWAGLPMVSCAGETFASRVAASLLICLDMSDCVTYDLVSYEHKIVSLLQEPHSLKALSERVSKGRTDSPLFDTLSTARHLEAAYAQMMAYYEADLPSTGFDISP